MTQKEFAKESQASAKRTAKRSLQMLAAAGLLVGAGFMQSCDRDILEGQPEWLGNSIYERLQEGIDGKTFKTTLRLIDDLDQTDVLSHTGSKTLFATSDEDYAKWFANNTWGVSKYEDLTIAQKKMLLNNSMINNAYLLELMSNVSGNPPQEGLCMRRPTASNVQDTVYTMTPDQMPGVSPLNKENLDTWVPFREKSKGVLVLKDNTASPMIHFLPNFMLKNKITDSDLKILTNGEASSIAESWVNGKKVVSEQQTCKNGYVYVVDGVIEANSNMAEIINSTPEMSQWAHLLNRFSTLEYDNASTETYRRLHNTNDSVFTLRYFADAGYGRNEYNKVKSQDGEDLNVPGQLTFDPGWNQYMWANTMGFDMHYDAGAMIVPTNEALEYWRTHDGKSLYETYGSWDNIPAKTISKLLRVNMLPSFVDAVPSKFSTIVDDSKVSLGIKESDIVKCVMGCNGIIYLVNKVFAPSEYRSVVYPALSDPKRMSVIYNAIDKYDFGPYLNSMESKFGVVLPFNTEIDETGTKNVLKYIDPCTYGLRQQVLFEFYLDENTQKIAADYYTVTFNNDGTYALGGSKRAQAASDEMIENRLSDLVNNLIILGNVDGSKSYYRTKAGSYIKINGAGLGVTSLAGGYQINNNTELTVNPDSIFDMSLTGNGFAFGLNGVPQTSQKSVYEVLKDNRAQCTQFYDLLESDASGTGALLSKTMSTGATQTADNTYYCTNDASNKNFKTFDNYHYTVYVPTNAAIKELINNKLLPTWTDYKNAKTNVAKQVIADRIHNFLRYHIQDNSVLIGGDNVSNVKYETSLMNPATKRYFSLTVNADASGMNITDLAGNTVHVVKDNGFYNKLCREYWMKKPSSGLRTLYSSSHAVVHQIDGVLLYDKAQFAQKWTDAVAEAEAAEAASARRK